MQNQKGVSFLAIIIVVVVVAVLGIAGYFVYKQYSAPKPTACTQEAKLCPDNSFVSRIGPNCEFAACPDQTAGLPVQSQQATEGWKTYTSNDLKYSFKYPSGWRVIPNYAYSAAGFGGLVGYTITTSNSKIAPDNERIDIGGAQVDCASLSNLNRQEHPAGVLCKTAYPVYTFSTNPEVINVFNIIADSISDIKPATSTDQTADSPVIASISPNSGSKGTIVEIRGRNLSGFEGDLDVYFERADGKKIMLTDTFGDYEKTGGNLIKVKVVEPCQKGEKVIGRYSGIESECNYIELTPGTYKVYAEPWGKKSNTVFFTITK